MKYFAAVFAMCMILTMNLFSQDKKNVIQPGSPTAAVSQLFNIYKNKNFRDARFITTGKEAEHIDQLISAMSNNFGQLPVHLRDYYSKLDEIRFLDENIKDNIARVDAILILKYKNKDNSGQTLKVNEVAYLLEKNGKNWAVRSSKFINQQVFYDYQTIQSIYKKARLHEQANDTKNSGSKK